MCTKTFADDDDDEELRPLGTIYLGTGRLLAAAGVRIYINDK